MLEPDALNGVGELDVDAEVVGVQLQPVVRPEAAVFLDVHRQRGDGAVERQPPVAGRSRAAARSRVASTPPGSPSAKPSAAVAGWRA